jgi:hypothetical protein
MPEGLFELGDLPLQSGGILPWARLAYGELSTCTR